MNIISAIIFPGNLPDRHPETVIIFFPQCVPNRVSLLVLDTGNSAFLLRDRDSKYFPILTVL